mmetsp:Transcript_43207/g.50694  ORF Transcript_43207/g.50694 Transcript_43207/m.50694 type:complete len:80 (+) Transcript_43207:801-1040(+)
MPEGGAGVEKAEYCVQEINLRNIDNWEDKEEEYKGFIRELAVCGMSKSLKRLKISNSGVASAEIIEILDEFGMSEIEFY